MDRRFMYFSYLDTSMVYTVLLSECIVIGLSFPHYVKYIDWLSHEQKLCYITKQFLEIENKTLNFFNFYQVSFKWSETRSSL